MVYQDILSWDAFLQFSGGATAVEMEFPLSTLPSITHKLVVDSVN